MTEREAKKFAGRLIKLAELLEQKSHYDRKTREYTVQIGKGRHVHWNMGTFGEKEEGVCGTVGCAAGTAAMVPWFQRRGLDMVFSEHGHGSLTLDGDSIGTSFDVCRGFFGTEFPFDAGGEDLTPKGVARDLRREARRILRERSHG